MIKFWSHARTRTPKGSRRCLISLWGWLRKIHSKFWIYQRWFMTSLRGWEWLCAMIKRSNGREAKVHVYSDSVLCHGRIIHPSEANVKWKDQTQCFQQSNQYAEFSGSNGEPIEFEWNIFPGFTSIEILKHIQKDLTAWQVNPDHFEGGILCNSMLNDIDWTKNENYSECISNAREVLTPKSFSEDIGHSLVLEMKKNCTELALSSQKENGTSKPIRWLMYAHRVVIPYSHAQVRPAEEHWSENKDETLCTSQQAQKKLIMRTVQSTNQLGIYGAVSSWCVDFSGSMQGQEYHWSEHVHFRRKRKVITTIESKRSWFFGKKNSTRTKGDGGNWKKVWNDHSRRTTSHCKRMTRIRQNSLERNVLHKWWGCGRWFGGIYCIMPKVHFISDPSTRTQRLVLLLMSKLSVITSFMNRHLGLLTIWRQNQIWVVISGSSNRHVDELRHREPENLPEEVAQECIQDQDKKHSQGERSEACILSHQKVREYLPAKRFSYGYKLETPVSKFVNKLVSIREQDRQAEQLIGNSKSPRLNFRFQRDGGSNFTDRDWIKFILKGSSQTRFQYCQNSCTNSCTFEPFKDTQEEKWLNLRWCVTFSYTSIGRSLYSTEDVHSIRSPYCVLDSSQEGEKDVTPDTQYSSHL